jgi:hypothetical protein
MHTFTPQSIANMVWAYATLAECPDTVFLQVGRVSSGVAVWVWAQRVARGRRAGLLAARFFFIVHPQQAHADWPDVTPPVPHFHAPCAGADPPRPAHAARLLAAKPVQHCLGAGDTEGVRLGSPAAQGENVAGLRCRCIPWIFEPSTCSLVSCHLNKPPSPPLPSPPLQGLLAATAGEVTRRLLDAEAADDFSRQHLANFIWALATLEHDPGGWVAELLCCVLQGMGGWQRKLRQR